MRRPFLFILIVLPICLSLAPRRPLLPGPEAQSQEPDWLFAGSVPTVERFDELARTDPLAMIEAGLARYREEVTGYRCKLVKRERIAGRLKGEEVIDVSFREKPFAVVMRWLEGAGEVESTLYVPEENGGRILVRPTGWKARLLIDGYAMISPNDERARESSRIGIDGFGMANGMLRTHRAWSRAMRDGRLDTRYLGLLTVPEANGQLCHVWERYCDPTGDAEGLTRVRLSIDAQTWLQVSSELWAGDELIAHYRFRDVEWNPEFAPGDFSPEIFTRGR